MEITRAGRAKFAQNLPGRISSKQSAAPVRLYRLLDALPNETSAS